MLSRLERSSVAETTRQLMSILLHDSLLTQFSYQGQKKKNENSQYLILVQLNLVRILLFSYHNIILVTISR